MKLCSSLLLITAGLSITPVVQAIPLLQIYVEGATYDTDHESWVFSDTDGGTIDLRLWVIGNTEGPGSKGIIEDVKLAITYVDQGVGKDADVSITGSTTGGFGGFTDPSQAADPGFNQYNDNGDIPLKGDGTAIATHGVYGDGWEWQEFALGDFALADSPIGDFIYDVPTPTAGNVGQINVYDISIAGDFTDVHFDAYDHVQAGNKARYIFAPYSHDAGTGINEPVPVPGPATLSLMGLGLLGLSRVKRRRSR